MTSLALAFLFIFELILALLLLGQWTYLRARLKKLDERVSESLDDQDLMDFQDRVSSLLEEVQAAGKAMVTEIEQRRAGLDRELGRARDAEKQLGLKIQAFDKAQEKSKSKIEEWIQRLGKKTSKARPSARPASAAALEAAGAELREISQPRQSRPSEPKAPKLSYLSREIRPADAAGSLAPAATRYLKVYEMADQGFSRAEIAKACGYLSGEIELILNLRPGPRA